MVIIIRWLKSSWFGPWVLCQTVAFTQSCFSPSLSPITSFGHFSWCCRLLPWLFLFCSLIFICHPLIHLSVVFSFVPPLCVFLCGVCLCRVSCVFLCTSWRSEGSPRWPGLSAPCWTWPRPDTPSPWRQPLLGLLSTSRQRSCRRTHSVGLLRRSC